MSKKQSPITAILIGAGIRGQEVYANWALKHPDDIKFIGVAEPHPERLQRFINNHKIDSSRSFTSWEGLLALGKIADLCFVCTQDTQHFEPAEKALELGYNVVLEKPMAVTLPECKRLVEISEKKGLELRICHVARYTQFFSRLKKAIHNGKIGEIININHAENVAYWHFVHGYVRGNWGNESQSSPVILAKTCHDLD